MSGVEAVAVLGVISSIIAIVDGTKKVWDAATDTKGLPEAFREVAGRLPIVKSILNSTEQRIKEDKLNDDSCKGVENIAKVCKEKAQKLEKLFDHVIPGEGASHVERYRKAVKVFGKGHGVEKLMQGILEDVNLLAGEKGISSASKAQQEQILKAIKEIAAVAPSIPEQEFQQTGFTNSNYGSGTQNNGQGENVLQGNAQQYNSGGGMMNFGNVHKNTQYISNSRPNEDEAQACLSALLLTNPKDDRDKLINDKGSRVDGTCQWIKSHTRYKSWLLSHSQLLWLSGGPGKGKTMLSIFLAEELEKTAISQDKLFLQYFCDNKDEKRNTAVAVLRGLIYQLLRSRPKLFDHILPDFKIQKTSLFSLETLWRVFERMVCDPALETTNCVLDGLDECDEVSLKVLLRKFAALFSANTVRSSACHLNLLVVSRRTPDFIRELLSRFPCISLDSDADIGISQDIELFIKAKVQELSEQKSYPQALRVHVESAFRKGAHGTFLWIGIVAKELEEYKMTDVEKALDLFHPGLDEMYARILLQIDSGHRDIAARILRWVVMAVRPLTLSELSLAIEPTVNSMIVTNRDKRIRNQISYCGNFLVIKAHRESRKTSPFRHFADSRAYRSYRRDGGDGGDEGDQEDQEDQEDGLDKFRVGLIHQSAKDYLLRKRPDSNSKLEAFRVKEDVANLEIARRCLEYLQSGVLEDISLSLWHITMLPRRFSLLSYATLYWHEHARFLARSADIFDSSHPFWKEESETRTSWLKAYWHCELSYGGLYEYEPPESFSKLHLASFFGIFSLVENFVLGEGWMNIIKRMAFLNKVDSRGMTALMRAAMRGNEAVVRLLLEKGARTEIKAKFGQTALTIAVMQGHHALVQILLDKGANINTKGSSGETALMEAIDYGHEAIGQLLVEKKVNTKAQSEDGETALMKAAASGTEALTQLLLEQGVDVQVRNRDGETALMKAAKRGNGAIIQLLLEQGADIKVRDEYGETALMKAAKRGNGAIIQLLLEQGEDIEARDVFDGTALTIAAKSGKKTVIQLLLEQGADVNVQDKWGETALMMATSHYLQQSRETVVRLLLEHGADINAVNEDGETALALARRLEHDDVVRLLTPD